MRFLYIIFLCYSFSMVNAQVVPDSIMAKIAPAYDQVGPLHRFFFGDSYRVLYNTPVKMPLIDLSKEQGGFKVIKLGGGMQTQSLRLEDASGREWVLRSIQKFPERSLPPSLRNTFAKDIVQDQISIAHPFGALTVPPFNEALGIPHVSPRLVYVGEDSVFGEFGPVFNNRAYMLEPRMPIGIDSDNTAKVIRKTLEDNDDDLDQVVTLKARLLDFVLGDWDRHEDNWRWNPIKDKGETLYEPIPRDRDKVYYKTSGLLPILLSYQWLKANLQPFGPKIRNVDQWNFNARHFDRFFLNDLNLEDWQRTAQEFQNTLTDSLIHQAMLQMPDTIVKLSAAVLERNIKIRRDSLQSTIKEYYKYLAKDVDIPLSAKREFIHVAYKDDGTIVVEVHNKKKDGTKGRNLYKRKFFPNETNEVRIYGISGEDEYKVSGSGKSAIKVRLIGGSAYDTYLASSDFNRNNKLYVYDQKSPDSNNIELGKGVRYRLSNDSTVNSYNYNQFEYDRKGVLVDVNYGIDRGLILGVGYLIQNQGFRKSPYAYSHSFMGYYLTGRRSFMFDYEGIYRQLWGKNDLLIHVNSLGPRNQSNFFGYGNETKFIKEDDDINDKEYGIEYYRNRYDMASADIYLQKQVNKSLRYYYGSSTDFYTSSEAFNEDRFSEDFHQEYPNEFIFGTKFFTGATVGVTYDSRNRKDLPQSGIYLNTDWGWRKEIGGRGQGYLKATNSISGYKTFFGDRITVANRVGVDAVFGSTYFFQDVQLGGENSLRGFNSRRFTGKTGVYNNFDVRIKLFESLSYVFPGSLGLIGFYDVGRVWMTNEKSNVWHNGTGGGIFVMPADLFVIQAVIGASKEAILPYIRVGLSF